MSIGWWNSSLSTEVSLRVIPTSRTHNNQYSDAIGVLVKQRVYTGRKVVHSGFGVHYGLEEGLRESKYCRYYHIIAPVFHISNIASILQETKNEQEQRKKIWMKRSRALISLLYRKKPYFRRD